MKKDELEEIYKINPELNKYINEYLNTEYNTSKNTRDSYATDLYLLAKYYHGKNINKLKYEVIPIYINKELMIKKTISTKEDERND